MVTWVPTSPLTPPRAKRLAKKFPRTASGTDQPLDSAVLSVLTEVTPRIWVVPAIVALNVVVYAAMVASGVHPLQPTVASVLVGA